MKKIILQFLLMTSLISVSFISMNRVANAKSVNALTNKEFHNYYQDHYATIKKGVEGYKLSSSSINKVYKTKMQWVNDYKPYKVLKPGTKIMLSIDSTSIPMKGQTKNIPKGKGFRFWNVATNNGNDLFIVREQNNNWFKLGKETPF
ncbi:hypothetical protein [Nicoliella lavandulae]|uniref:Uncharacterized protein n=1 Tax=Nicoliella lavandulae TaxID=3082954 RepID=A0ABU8SNF3_9LACO